MQYVTKFDRQYEQIFLLVLRVCKMPKVGGVGRLQQAGFI